jgi:zinc protease
MAKSVQSNINSLPGQFETGGAVMGSMMSNQRFGRDDDYVGSLTGRYQDIDLDDVHDAAGNVIKADRLTWMVVGDREKIEAELKALELGPVSVIVFQGAR